MVEINYELLDILSYFRIASFFISPPYPLRLFY